MMSSKSHHETSNRRVQQKRHEKKRNHHFFLFRHCVRSTHQDVHLHMDTSFSKDLADYVGPDTRLPDWGVPEEWCTEDALTLVKNTGKWLASPQGPLFAVSDGHNNDIPSRIFVEVIADTSHRDVDTAFVLAQGLAEGFQDQTNVVHVEGLDQLHYEPWMFKPLHSTALEEVEVQPTQENSSDTAFCQAKYTEEELLERIQNRIAAVPPPTSLSSALEFLMEHAGVGSVGNLTQVLPVHNISALVSADREHLMGAPSLLKDFAERVFYSRAGNITPSFLPRLSNQDVYQLLQWVYWTRGIMKIDNPKGATQGAVLAEVLLHVLKQGTIHNSDKNDENDYDTYVTILAGHDGNIDDLATALGATWVGPDPYRSSNAGPITPPLSAIYAKRNVVSNQIDLSFLCPVYSQEQAHNNEKDAWLLNASGILEQVPLLWKNQSYNANRKATQRQFASVTDSSASILTGNDALARLEQRITHILDSYTGASSCFQVTKSFLHQLGSSNSGFSTNMPPQDHQWPYSIDSIPSTLLLASLLATAVVTISCIVANGRRRKRPTAMTSSYSEVDSETNINCDMEVI